ncbi:hypothetical protein CRG98_022919, partial [Punica granatum]
DLASKTLIGAGELFGVGGAVYCLRRREEADVQPDENTIEDQLNEPTISMDLSDCSDQEEQQGEPLDCNDQGEQLGGHARLPRVIKIPAKFKDFVMSATSSSAPHLSPRANTSSGTVHPLQTHISYARLSNNHCGFIAAIDDHEETRTFSQAMKDARWREAMAREIEALEDNSTWSIQPLPPEKKATNCKWIYNLTTTPIGVLRGTRLGSWEGIYSS